MVGVVILETPETTGLQERINSDDVEETTETRIGSGRWKDVKNMQHLFRTSHSSTFARKARTLKEKRQPQHTHKAQIQEHCSCHAASLR